MENKNATVTQNETVVTETKPKKPRGMAACDPETRRRVAQAGGRAASRDPEKMREIGRKGAAALVAARGVEHMAAIGKKGATACLEKHGKEHYARIGRLGGLNRHKAKKEN